MEAGRADNRWGNLNCAEREEWKECLGLEALLTGKNYRYQSLDDDHCFIQTGTGLYGKVYLIGQRKGQLQYVFQLTKLPPK